MLEIMVAVSLLAIIIVGLLAMFYQVQRAFRAGTAQVDVMEGGRATIGVLARELQEMIPTREDFTMNLLITPPPEKNLQPAAPDDFTVQEIQGGGVRANYLRDICFISKVNDEWLGVAYRFTNAASGVGTLLRMVVRTNADSNPAINSALLRDLSTLVATSRVDHPSFHRVVDGVVHFYVDAFYPTGLALTNQFTLPGQADTVCYGFTNRLLPTQLDLELGVLEPAAVEKFRARLDIGRDRATNYLAKVSGRTHLFHQRITIKAAEAGLEQD